ncbi:HNH endonuclease [Pseudomonas sp. P7759]|nr:HNH endonuclease [Pseudomonas sp. P7759]
MPKRQSNPAWSRDELILALDLYLRYRTALPSKDHPHVLELSNLLGRLGGLLSFGESGTFRNANGVHMKLGNFRRWDPEYVKDGRTGLAKGNKDEGEVWSAFANHPDKLAGAVFAIRRAVEGGQIVRFLELEAVDEFWVQDAEEGKLLTVLHRIRERKRSLVEAKKKDMQRRYGQLRCEACDFNFSEHYGPGAQGIIDVHHIKPVHTLRPGEKTKLSDLALVCANCHRVIHSRKKWLTVQQVRALYDEFNNHL